MTVAAITSRPRCTWVWTCACSSSSSTGTSSGDGIRMIFLTLFTFCCCGTNVLGFHARLPMLTSRGSLPRMHKTYYYSSSSSDFDDVIGEGDGTDASGEALAKEFYEQLRAREGLKQVQPQPESESDPKSESKSESKSEFKADPKSEFKADPKSESTNILNKQEVRPINRDAFGKRKEMKGATNANPPKSKKFTGQRTANTTSRQEMDATSSSTSAGLFSGEGDSVYSFPARSSMDAPSSARERMVEQEFRLLGRPEQTIAIQALIAVLMLSFYIYVGMTGGITDRVVPDMFDPIAESMAVIEDMHNNLNISPEAPVSVSSDGSVWL